jgi:hypothetical protein
VSPRVDRALEICGRLCCSGSASLACASSISSRTSMRLRRLTSSTATFRTSAQRMAYQPPVPIRHTDGR